MQSGSKLTHYPSAQPVADAPEQAGRRLRRCGQRLQVVGHARREAQQARCGCKSRSGCILRESRNPERAGQPHLLVAAVAETDALVALDLLSMTTTNLRHAEDHMLLLGRKTSLERVAAFLREMDPRLTAAGVMALPMSRRDIADYLGLTLETVSRALSHLHGMGILGFLGQTQRQIVLLDRVRLAELDL